MTAKPQDCVLPTRFSLYRSRQFASGFIEGVDRETFSANVWRVESGSLEQPGIGYDKRWIARHAAPRSLSGMPSSSDSAESPSVPH